MLKKRLDGHTRKSLLNVGMSMPPEMPEGNEDNEEDWGPGSSQRMPGGTAGNVEVDWFLSHTGPQATGPTSLAAHRRLAVLKQQLGDGATSASANYNACVRSVDGQLFLEFGGADYANCAAYFGPTPDRDAILASENLLFRGFTDGMPNVMLVPDPYEGKQRIYIVMMPASLKNENRLSFGDVFAESIFPHSGLTNFRDMGGIEVALDPATGERRSLRWGSLFRHGAISDSEMNVDCVSYLRSLRLKTNVDLREAREVALGPQVWPGQTASVSVPGLLPASVLQASAELTAEKVGCVASKASKEGVQRQSQRQVRDRDPAHLVMNSKATAALKKALKYVMEPANHPISFNCVAGRDRTGWLAALLLMILGACRENVIADYMVSNDLVARGRNRSESKGQSQSLEGQEIKEEYITASLDIVNSVFGGLEGYLAELGVEPEACNEFREFMLV
jgi:protein-tyrosine phosphatase